MRFNMLQLLKNLRFHSQSQGKEMTDADILNWANNKVKSTGRNSQMDSFKDKSLSDGVFFLELLSAMEPRVVNWSVVTKGEDDMLLLEHILMSFDAIFIFQNWIAFYRFTKMGKCTKFEHFSSRRIKHYTDIFRAMRDEIFFYPPIILT
ncbi:hypothetical protein Syun_011785 [Stephania yunnanensis]|uniref:Calponin-homology (CH) domain-containing protein n=1 Tax=Stephania yunnanensis TaxID=152371 RepID=A0AAP0JZ79_9MAGN